MTVRVVIVGAGIGAEHLEGYRALPERYSVETVCDLDIARAEAVVVGSGIAVTADFDAVLADGSIDLIDICLPPHLHFEMSMAALKAGKHVVCEKPLCTSLRDADALAAQAEASGKIVAPVFQYRYGPETEKLHRLMAAGLTGKPLVASLETHWHRDAEYYAVPWRGTWAGEQGGAVLGHAIHAHDLLCLFFGPVAQLTGFATTRVNDIETEDCAALSIAMANGAVASSSITLGAADDQTRLRFCFDGLTAESGTAPYSPAEDAWTFTARGSVSQAEVDACIAEVGDVPSGFAGFFAALADRLEGRGGREVTVADGRRSLELVTSIYDATRNGAVVALPLGERHALYGGWAL